MDASALQTVDGNGSRATGDVEQRDGGTAVAGDVSDEPRQAGGVERAVLALRPRLGRRSEARGDQRVQPDDGFLGKAAERGVEGDRAPPTGSDVEDGAGGDGDA